MAHDTASPLKRGVWPLKRGVWPLSEVCGPSARCVALKSGVWPLKRGVWPPNRLALQKACSLSDSFFFCPRFSFYFLIFFFLFSFSFFSRQVQKLFAEDLDILDFSEVSEGWQVKEGKCSPF